MIDSVSNPCELCGLRMVDEISFMRDKADYFTDLTSSHARAERMLTFPRAVFVSAKPVSLIIAYLSSGKSVIIRLAPRHVVLKLIGSLPASEKTAIVYYMLFICFKDESDVIYFPNKITSKHGIGHQ